MGKRYRCQFPGCPFETDEAWQIETHHIVPRELGGCDRPYNLVDLCPNCHNRVFVPEARLGQHSRRTEDSIVIRRWVRSSGGMLLEYASLSGEVGYHFPRSYSSAL